MKPALLFLACATCLRAAAPTPPIGVPADAKFYHDKWYRVYLEKLTWQQAKEKCKALGGRLVVVPDEETWKFVQSLTQAIIWLGATDEKAEGQWVWVTGAPMTFTAWMDGQPDNTGGNENYLAARAGKWNDVANSNKTPAFICEWDAPKPAAGK